MTRNDSKIIKTNPINSSNPTQNQPINILIVDDEVKNLIVLETILECPEYKLHRAETPEQALLALVSEEFALLILDIRMPQMSGFELAQMIKSRKKTASVPIIFLTAYYNEDQNALIGYESGAVDYLHKPVNPTVLRSKVATFAELHRNARKLEKANNSLTLEIEERRQIEEQLREFNQTLEQRVAQRTQELRETDRRKDEFLAMLAHELRNPLAPVRNAVQILQVEVPDNPRLTWATEVIDRQVSQMSRLINDLMDVARISQGKIELKREPVQLEELIQLAVETSEPLINELKQELSVTLPPEPLVLIGDLTRLSQVFLNLLNNAAKFSNPGNRIYLTAESTYNEVCIKVKDEGIGIPSEKLASIFDLFAQIHEGPSRYGGLGIGLCLAKKLIELHGGSIEAASEGISKGSEFTVRLPLNRVHSIAAPTKSLSQFSVSAAVKLRVLVVDDNVDAAKTLGMLLKIAGHTVHLAHDGPDALKSAELNKPDVALLDIGLPTMNGYDVARAIREQSWGTNMTLIATTGWGMQEDKQHSADAGFDRHLVKPVDPQLLLQMLSKVDTTR